MEPSLLRALKPDEKELLDLLVQGNWDGADESRRQIEGAQHAGWFSPGSPSFFIAVDPLLPSVPLPDGILAPSDRTVYDGDTCIGGVMLWITAGRIDFLEYYWVTEESPTRLPTPTQIRIR